MSRPDTKGAIMAGEMIDKIKEVEKEAQEIIKGR